MIIFLFILAVGSSFISGISYKYGSMRFLNDRYAPPLLCLVYTFMAAVIYIAVLCITTPNPVFTPALLGLAAVSGSSLAVAAVLFLTALECGPYTVTNALLNFSTFLPILYSSVFLNESITVIQLIGVFLLMGVIGVLVFFGREHQKDIIQKNVNIKWIIIVIVMVIVNSAISFTLRCQVKLLPEQTSEMLPAHFGMSALASLIMFIITGGLHSSFKESVIPAAKRLFAPALGLTLGLGINILCQTYIPMYNVPAAIQYPVISASSIMASTLAGKFIFHEKLKPAAYFALFAGIGVIVMISL